MPDSPFSRSASSATFQQLVIENSAKGPVLVSFWAPWAGPCLKAIPVMEKLAADYGGRFLLVHVNTDEEKDLVREEGIRSIPTLKLYRNGRVVHVYHGPQPEADLRALLDRHIASPLGLLHAEGLRAYRAGDPAGAVALLARAAREEPANPRLALDRAKLLLKGGDPGAALAVLQSLPEAARGEAEVAHLSGHLELIAAAEEVDDVAALEAAVSADADDTRARYALAAVRTVSDDYAAALALLLDVLRRAADADGGRARRGMLALFALLGAEHPLVREYRARLTDLAE
jgi:putative thioredoxin